MRVKPCVAACSRKLPPGDERVRVSSRKVVDIFCKREGRKCTTARRAGSLKGTAL